MPFIRGNAIAFAVVAIAAIRPSTAAAAIDPCAKQVRAVQHAKSAHGKHVAREHLEACRIEHGVSIAPATPRANEAITVTIHPWRRLCKGCEYEVTVLDANGKLGDGFAHFESRNTRKLSVVLRPTEVQEAFGPPVTQWAPGDAFVAVEEGKPGGSLRELSKELPKEVETGGPRAGDSGPLRAKGRHLVGLLEIQFLPVT